MADTLFADFLKSEEIRTRGLLAKRVAACTAIELANEYVNPACTDERRAKRVTGRYVEAYGNPIVAYILLQLLIGIISRLVVRWLENWWDNWRQEHCLADSQAEAEVEKMTVALSDAAQRWMEANGQAGSD